MTECQCNDEISALGCAWIRSDRAITNDPDAFRWVVAETGTMALVSEDRGTRSEDDEEFVGGYSRFVIYTFEATEVGTTQLQFESVPVGDPSDQPANARHLGHHHRLSRSSADRAERINAENRLPQRRSVTFRLPRPEASMLNPSRNWLTRNWPSRQFNASCRLFH